MMPTVAAPSSDRQGEPVSIFAQEVELWRRAAYLGVTKRASALVLHTDPAVRDVCVSVGCGRPPGPGAVRKITQVLHDYFAPGALDSVYQHVARLLHFQ